MVHSKLSNDLFLTITPVIAFKDALLLLNFQFSFFEITPDILHGIKLGNEKKKIQKRRKQCSKKGRQKCKGNIGQDFSRYINLEPTMVVRRINHANPTKPAGRYVQLTECSF